MNALPSDIVEGCGWNAYVGAWQAGMMPDPPLWIDEWSSMYMVIPASTGAAEAGPYRLDRTPYAREILRSLSPESRARTVVVRGASQMLKTQCGINAICAWIVNSPANIIVLEPTDHLARRLSSRFDKTAEAVPAIKAVVAPPKSRDKTNRNDTKEFRGGTLWILTGRSASNLREASARYLWVDEVTGLLRELKREGDPISLLRKRASTFGRNAKEYYTSSGGEDGNSRITELFESGDQRFPLAKCPHCGENQILEWDRLQYDLAAGWARYPCQACGVLIDEHHKSTMFEAGVWTATAAGDGETHSYEISYLYAPLGWDPWIKLAKEFEAAKAELAIGDPEKMQVFYNTRLARDWSFATSEYKPEDLAARRENFPLGVVPAPAAILTAACDVQHHRLEVQIVGWGWGACGLEAWIVNTHVIYGDTTLDSAWNELDEVLKTPIRHAGGALLIIRAAMVDASDGNRSDEIYEFCRMRQRRWVRGKEQAVLAIKGHPKPGKPVVATKPSKVDVNHRGRFVPRGAELWLIGTDTAKDWIFNRIELAGRNAIHFSKDLPIEYFRQILSESRQIVRRRGQKITVYTHHKGEPNEMLDTLGYAYAAACWLGLHRYPEERWSQLRSALGQADLLDSVVIDTEIEIDESAKSTLATPPAINLRVSLPSRKPKDPGLGTSEWTL